ncbi:TlpA family protein disulfide reductase [Aquirufa ecclesiirivi]|uniref:TlpA family protein disulfide reductase n=2 Tax=Aquirufa ecclesiirivi TaxID=2715124 RepID=UPI0030A32A40|nr:hypothetical protein [Aquirufa ecclesiirivi]
MIEKRSFVFMGSIGFLITFILLLVYFKYVELRGQRSLPKSKNITWIQNKPLRENYKIFLIVLIFHPDCDYCKYEATEIFKNREKFSRVNFWWISYAKKTEILAFKNKYLPGNIDEMSIGFIPIDKLSNIFGNVTIPHIYIYNNDKLLIKEFKGETKMDALIQFIK